MQWRTNTLRERRKRRVALVALSACALLAASCGDDPGNISIGPRATTSVAETTTTTVAETTTAPPESTTAAPESTTAPPQSIVPATVAPPLPGDHQGEGDTAAGPRPEVVRPPAAWIGFGLPQPGSMFENLHEDHALDGKGKFVAFTFDDGPSQYTKPIFDILKFMGVQATFFQISRQSLANQDQVKEMLAAGMHIGSHTINHPHLAEIPPDQQQAEVLGSIDQMNAAYGAGTIKCFRPPYAQYDQHVLDLVNQRGAATAMWSLDTLDWKKPAWQSLVTRVVDGAQDRNVLLFHDGGGDRTQTILALPWIIQGLRDKGFQFIPVC